KFGRLPSDFAIQDEGPLVSDDGTTRVVFALAEAADAKLGVGLRRLVVGADVQKSSRSRRASLLASTHELESSREPLAGRRAREFSGRPERAALGLALTPPTAEVVGQLLNFRTGLGLLSCGGMAGSGERHDQQERAHRD